MLFSRKLSYQYETKFKELQKSWLDGAQADTLSTKSISEQLTVCNKENTLKKMCNKLIGKQIESNIETFFAVFFRFFFSSSDINSDLAFDSLLNWRY